MYYQPPLPCFIPPRLTVIDIPAFAGNVINLWSSAICQCCGTPCVLLPDWQGVRGGQHRTAPQHTNQYKNKTPTPAQVCCFTDRLLEDATGTATKGKGGTTDPCPSHEKAACGRFFLSLTSPLSNARQKVAFPSWLFSWGLLTWMHPPPLPNPRSVQRRMRLFVP